MAQVYERIESRRSSGNIAERRYERVFVVVADPVDGDAVDPGWARQQLIDSTTYAIGIGTPFELPNALVPTFTDAAMQAVEIAAESTGNLGAFDVSVVYSTSQGLEDFDPIGGITLVEDVPPVITMGYERVESEVWWSWEDYGTYQAQTRDIVNSAGQPFDPPLTESQYHRWIQIERNEDRTLESMAERMKIYSGAINLPVSGDRLLYGAGPYQVKCEMSADQRHDAGVDYWRVTYRLSFREYPRPTTSDPLVYDGWNRVLIDMGTATLITNDGEGYTQQSITDDKGVPADTQVPLDGAGQVQQTNSDGTITLVPLLPPFQTLPAADFEDLDLPGAYPPP